MKRLLWLCQVTLLCLFSVKALAVDSNSTLTVYTYSSFTSKWGPGPELTKLFEKNCHCQINWVGLDDGVSVLNRLRLERSHTKADAIVGLDTNLMYSALKLKLVAPHQLDISADKLAIQWHNKDFIPYDRGQFAFVYNRKKLANPPHSLKDLVDNFKGTIIYEDPRTSTPGLGLLLWVKAVYGDKAPQAWTKLAEKTVTVTKSWDDAYGMFLKGQADMVLSYTTDSAYHKIEENNSDYLAAKFSEGHYQQIEVAAISAYAKHKKLAREFLQFLLTPQAQRIIALNNWMLPVREGVKLPQAFHDIIHPKALMLPAEQVAKNRQNWIRQWRNAVSQ